ncbi:hypothetical protein ZWY2020_022607 [Hordeum vulgare]|nr:hypothetical protein ZWY2020_022607 [Hordeum vulgare]
MSSVMERLRFLGLYRFRSDDFPPEYNYNPSASDTVGTKADTEGGRAVRGSMSKADLGEGRYTRSQSCPLRAEAEESIRGLWVLTGDDDVIDPMTLEKEK